MYFILTASKFESTDHLTWALQFWFFLLAPLPFVILRQDFSVDFKSCMDPLASFPFTELTAGERSPTEQKICIDG